MSTAPLPTNKTAEILNQFVSTLLKDGEKAAEAYLTALDPEFLSIPIVQWILDQEVAYVGQLVSIAGQHFVTAAVMDFQTNGEKSNVINAGVALQLAKASGDAAAIAKATGALYSAWGSVIHFDGIAPPK